MNEFTVTVDNVRECWEYYEQYIEEFFNEHYSDASYEDFVEWCENELMECPNCGEIIKKDTQEHLDNLNGVCDQCIINGYYE